MEDDSQLSYRTLEDNTEANSSIASNGNRRWVTVGLTAGFIVSMLIVIAAAVAPRNPVEHLQRSVVILRHCARSTPLTVEGGAEGFNFLNNYTNETVPDWPVPPYQCLERGKVMIEDLARYLRPTLPQPISILSDSSQRDIDSSNAFLKGLSLDLNFKVVPALFDPVRAGVCNGYQPEEVEAILKAQFRRHPPTTEHMKNMSFLQDRILGKGEAPALFEIPDKISGIYFGGGSYIASAFIELFVMQFAGGLDVAWNRISPNTIYELMVLRTYYRMVQARATEICRRTHSNMLSSIVKNLFLTEQGSVIYVGHDADLDAIGTLLNLRWNPAPFPENVTSPGSGVRLDYDPVKEQVTASYIYTTFDKNSTVSSSQAYFTVNGNSKINSSLLKSTIRGQIDASCVEDPHKF